MISAEEKQRQKLIKLAIESSRDNFLRFTALTKKGYEIQQHHRAMARALTKVAKGEIRRLMLFLPPRHGKSELSSIRFPAWMMGRNPKLQVILSAYDTDLAKHFGRQVRDLVADPHFRAIFPEVRLKTDSMAADCWYTTDNGVFLSAGIGSGITGWGANLAIIDDPIKNAEEGKSKLVKDKVWDWYTTSLYTRLMPDASIIVTLTRWAEDDLAGRILADGSEEWTVIRFPAIAEDEDELGRKAGEALWPERYPIKELEKRRMLFGSEAFEALYQQNPIAEEGNIFKKHWWQYYGNTPNFEYTLISWDTAFKEGEENDYCVATVWGYKHPNIYLVDRIRKRMDFPELKRSAEVLSHKHRPRAVLVEDAASGQSLIQELRRESIFPVIPVKVHGRSKEMRAHSCTPLIEGGRVLLPDFCGWVDEYVGQLANFPKGKFDDDVDSTTLALNYLKPYSDTFADDMYEDFDGWDMMPMSSGGYQPNNADAGY